MGPGLGLGHGGPGAAHTLTAEEIRTVKNTQPVALSLSPTSAAMPATATGGRTCPKCSYRRRTDDSTPAWQCPRCGIAYDKVALPTATRERAALRAEASAQAQRRQTRPSRLPWLLLAAALAGTGWWTWQQRAARAAQQAAAPEVAARQAAVAKAADELAIQADIELAEHHLRMAKPAEGLALLERRAAEGHPDAMMALGVAYRGYGHAPTDAPKAEHWMRLAAREGSLLAYVHLGLAHEMGRDTPRNIGEAANLYRVAARQGNAYALFALGLLYGNGAPGMPAEPVAGLMLLELAHQAWNAEPRVPVFAPSDRSPHWAEYKAKKLAETMPAADVLKARDWAAAWKPGQLFPFH